jgi:hypothetical protein
MPQASTPSRPSSAPMSGSGSSRISRVRAAVCTTARVVRVTGPVYFRNGDRLSWSICSREGDVGPVPPAEHQVAVVRRVIERAADAVTEHVAELVHQRADGLPSLGGKPGLRRVTVPRRVEAEQHVGEAAGDRRLARQDMRAAEVLGTDHTTAHLAAQARHVVRSFRVTVVQDAGVVRLPL